MRQGGQGIECCSRLHSSKNIDVFRRGQFLSEIIDGLTDLGYLLPARWNLRSSFRPDLRSNPPHEAPNDGRMTNTGFASPGYPH